jgi:hypothetical protein
MQKFLIFILMGLNCLLYIKHLMIMGKVSATQYQGAVFSQS